MTKNFSYLLGMLITIAIGTFLYFTLCSDCQMAVEEVEMVTEDVSITKIAPTSFPFAFTNGDFTVDINDNFNFNGSSYTLLTPLSANLDGALVRVKSFLAENKDKVIQITGLYREDEENPSAYPNLGLARANAVKNYMVSKGIPSNQTGTFGKLLDDLVPDGTRFKGPLTYAIGQGTDNEEDLKALCEEIKANPLVQYFETGQTTISLTAEQRLKFAKIARYLDKVADANCDVLGYTDNIGDRIANTTLGQERADFAMSYLIRNGIAADRINSMTKGQEEPITLNSTEEGRTKNRRTLVTLH